MPMWPLTLMIVAFGVIAIIHGVAINDPSFSIDRWLSYLLGVSFIVAGIFGLVRGDWMARIPLSNNDRPVEFKLGITMAVLSAVAAIYVAIAYPFTSQYWKLQAWWIGWVYVAGLLCFTVVGILLAVDGVVGFKLPARPDLSTEEENEMEGKQ